MADVVGEVEGPGRPPKGADRSAPGERQLLAEAGDEVQAGARRGEEVLVRAAAGLRRSGRRPRACGSSYDSLLRNETSIAPSLSMCAWATCKANIRPARGGPGGAGRVPAGSLRSCGHPNAMAATATARPEARPARGSPRLLRGGRPRRADGRAGARAPRGAGLRPQGDRPQQARGRAARQARGDLRRGGDRGARGRARRLLRPRGRARAFTRTPQARELRTIDATCPLVTKVHVEARKFAERGLHDHPRSATRATRRSRGPPARRRRASSSSRPRRRSTTLEIDDPEHVAFITQTTLSRRRDDGDHRPPQGEVPEDRRAEVRRHLLRDDQPPDRRQAAGPRVRPRPRHRLRRTRRTPTAWWRSPASTAPTRT